MRQIDASIFEGNDPARKPAFVTINQISPEKGVNPAPLYIQREGGIKEAVHEGDTISIGKNPNADELTFK